MGTTIRLDKPRSPAALSSRAAFPHPAPDPDVLKLVIIWPWLGMGGAERWLIAMAQNLPQISAELGSTLSSPAAASSRAALPRKIVVSAVIVQYEIDRETRLELERFAPVIVHRQIEQSSPEIDAAVSAADAVIIGGVPDIRRLARDARGPVIFIAHGACSLTTQLAGEAHASGQATHFTAVSEVSRSIFPSHVRPLVTVIENGAEVERTTPLRGRDWQREQWGVLPGQIAIGYVGRFGPDKRSEALAEAIAWLPDNYVGVMIGDGDTQTDALNKARRMAPGRIIYGGKVRHVGDTLAALDGWLNASPAEGFCLSRIEAALAGVPVISTPTGDLPRLESLHGEMVWTVPVGASGREIASVIRTCFAEGHARRERARIARDVSMAHYTSGAMVARWVEFLGSVLNSRAT